MWAQLVGGGGFGGASGAEALPLCPYGARCYRQSARSRGDLGRSRGDNREIKGRYASPSAGARCYRQSEQHRAAFRHAPLPADHAAGGGSQGQSAFERTGVRLTLTLTLTLTLIPTPTLTLIPTLIPTLTLTLALSPTLTRWTTAPSGSSTPSS